MKKLRNRVAGALRRIPARIRSEVLAVATSFGATFIATARPVLPALLNSPHLSTLHALLASTIAAALAAGASAAFPMAVLYTSEEVARGAGDLHITVNPVAVAADLEKLAGLLAPHLHKHLEQQQAENRAAKK